MPYNSELLVIAQEACRIGQETTTQAISQQLELPIDQIVHALAEAVFAEDLCDEDIPECIYSLVYEEVSGK